MTVTGGDSPRGSSGVEPTVGPQTTSGVGSANTSWQWLESTRKLQEEYFGRRFPYENPDEFADAVVMNHSALIVELGEFMQEVGWKEWAAPRGWVNRDAALKELVDVGHFLANLLVALDVTDDEWETRYREKQEVNRNRQRSGTYDGVSTKCPTCHRAYDDPETQCEPASENSVSVCWDHAF